VPSTGSLSPNSPAGIDASMSLGPRSREMTTSPSNVPISRPSAVVVTPNALVPVKRDSLRPRGATIALAITLFVVIAAAIAIFAFVRPS
jgi:hypothetical protein